MAYGVWRICDLLNVLSFFHFSSIYILEFVVELRIQQTWNKDLENENSQGFKELSGILEIQARI